MVCHRLSVIAGGHRNHAAAPLVGGQGGELDAGATLLERVGDLKIFVFDEYVSAGQGRQCRRRQERRAQHMTRDRAAGRLDVGERHHRRHFSHFPPTLQCQNRRQCRNRRGVAARSRPVKRSVNSCQPMAC
jgi:hypothetical protein